MVDFIIGCIIVLCILNGYRKGLTGILFKIISFVLALFIALILHGPISNFIIQNTTIDDQIEKLIIQNMNGEVQGETTVAGKNFSETMLRNLNQSLSGVKDNVEVITARSITNMVINIGVLILILFITRIVLEIVSVVLNVVAKLPIIKQFNTVGGIACGALEGLIIVYILLAICALIAPIFTNWQIIHSIQQSHIGSMMYNHNILLKIIL